MLFSTTTCALALLSIFATASAHTVITYPGWRGDNLHANGTVEDTNGLGTDGEYWPYGMQWSYPCKLLWHEIFECELIHLRQAAACQPRPIERNGH